MLMVLGLFVFSIDTATFDNFQRQNSWNWAANRRVKADTSFQYTGRGEEIFTINGTLAPEISGGASNLDTLRVMADKGEPYLLISGSGQVFGYFLIEGINETHNYLLPNGQALKIDFSLTLKRYAGANASGNLSPLIQLNNI